MKPKNILTNSRRLRNTDDYCCRVEEVSFSVHVEKLWNRIIDSKSILPEIHEVDVEKSSSRATMDHKYCRKFSQLNLSKIQINYALKESYWGFFLVSRMSGLDPECWTEMMQSKVADMNASLINSE